MVEAISAKAKIALIVLSFGASGLLVYLATNQRVAKAPLSLELGEMSLELEGILKVAGLPFENLQAQQVRSNQRSVSVSASPASWAEGGERRLLSSLEGRGWRQLSEGLYCKKPLLLRWNFDCKTCKPVYLRMTQFNAEENRC